ncbi:MAG: hypothetical protein IAE83_17645 [Anaerolinea sp.]|nr:hypothetical protein [Anaerolinea sp.]
MDIRDPRYWERREKKIREMHELRALYPILIIAGIIMLPVGLFLLGAIEVFGIVALAFGGSLILGGVIISAMQRASFAAEKAINEEYERFLALYGKDAEKPKRQPMRLTDDGELETSEDDLEAATRAKSGRAYVVKD